MLLNVVMQKWMDMNFFFYRFAILSRSCDCLGFMVDECDTCSQKGVLICYIKRSVSVLKDSVSIDARR